MGDPQVAGLLLILIGPVSTIGRVADPVFSLLLVPLSWQLKLDKCMGFGIVIANY